ncbi:MAG TPA: hypothetical protein VGR35_12420 [Tepidisphaeraceae bacterium]|nr:hypothetical protein [Tepidisphaeraceae bacterium]
MSAAYRRFEILLPLRFNDGSAVPPEVLADTFLELRTRFRAASAETQLIRGTWIHEGQEYADELVRYFVDTPDVPEHFAFFEKLKETLKHRFKQIEIWIVSYPCSSAVRTACLLSQPMCLLP